MEAFSDRLYAAIRPTGHPGDGRIGPADRHVAPALAARGPAERLGGPGPGVSGSSAAASIDVVAPLVPVVKPQAAFFEELGPAGMECLEKVIRYAQSKGLLVVLDGKRNDIGSTATAYAKGLLGRDG